MYPDGNKGHYIVLKKSYRGQRMSLEQRKLLQASRRRQNPKYWLAGGCWAIATGFLLQGCQLFSSHSSTPLHPPAPTQTPPVQQRRPIKLVRLAPLSPSMDGVNFTQAIAAEANGAETPTSSPSWVEPAAKRDALSPRAPSPTELKVEGLSYQRVELPTSLVHLVRISPQASVQLSVALSRDLTPVAELAQQVPGAIAAINAGFFDPNNAHSMNFVTQNGVKTADPTQNQLLMSNVGIQPYLDKVLNRSEFRHYRCGVPSLATSRYAIQFHQAPTPQGCKLLNAVGGGPQLLPRITAMEEAFWAEQGGRVVRDAIGMQRPNARSAVALTAKGEILLAMVAQQSGPQSDIAKPGLSLAELALFLQGQGATQALNLDGGSSSALYWVPQTSSPQTAYGKRDANGQPIRRAVKSILVVSATPSSP